MQPDQRLSSLLSAPHVPPPPAPPLHRGGAAHGPLPIRVALTDSAGRGVFATHPIAAGEVLHSAQPLVSHPSRSLLHEVCYSCLRRKAGKGGDSSGAATSAATRAENMLRDSMALKIIWNGLC
ncbi:hypothetical protein ACQ4PT_024704 [Festuca glaucescens]